MQGQHLDNLILELTPAEHKASNVESVQKSWRVFFPLESGGATRQEM